MSADDRGWAGGGNGPFEGVAHRLGFALFGHATDPRVRSEEARASDGHGITRHIRERSEMALADLLTAARIVKGNALQHRGVLEICDMRVVESDVAVFAKAYEREINGGLSKETRVPFDFRI